MKKDFVICLLILSVFVNACGQNKAKDQKLFSESFMQDSCQFRTTGQNAYFILQPGYQLVLEGIDGKDSTRLVITVLNGTRKTGNVETRVVEENESVNGQTIEISRNFFAFCQQTNSVYYFGEEVDMYKNGKIISHEGAWVAEGKNKAGIAMPGLILLGARYYQEMAPGVAMDRAEIISTSESRQTSAGNFMNCLKTEESSALNPKEKEFKWYAPGIGLIQDENLVLVKYGFLK